MLDSKNEAYNNLTIVDDVITLGDYGSYTYYFTLDDYPDIVSQEGSFLLAEPVVYVYETEKVFDADVTIE